jgi:hypothetical protein
MNVPISSPLSTGVQFLDFFVQVSSLGGSGGACMCLWKCQSRWQ